MTHRIDVRLPDDLYADLRKLDGKMTHNVCSALTQFVYNDTQKAQNEVLGKIQYDHELIQHLNGEVEYLRQLMQKMSDRVFLLPESNNQNGNVARNIDFKPNLRVVNASGRKRAQMSPRALKINPTRNVKTNNKPKRAKKGFWARLLS